MFRDIFPMLATQEMELERVREEIRAHAANGETNFTIDLDDYCMISEYDIQDIINRRDY